MKRKLGITVEVKIFILDVHCSNVRQRCCTLVVVDGGSALKTSRG